MASYRHYTISTVHLWYANIGRMMTNDANYKIGMIKRSSSLLLKLIADIKIKLNKIIPFDFVRQIHFIIILHTANKRPFTINGAKICLTIKMTANTITPVQKSGLFTFMDLATAFTAGCAGECLKIQYVYSLNH